MNHAETLRNLAKYGCIAETEAAACLAGAEALREKEEREEREKRVQKARDRYRELDRKLRLTGDLTEAETEEIRECYFEGEME